MPLRKKTAARQLVPVEAIQRRILLLRGQKVMLDAHLAELYQVTTSALNKAVKRNIDRFPTDFMFQIAGDEFDSLRFHFGISKEGRGGRRYMPYVFTEQGVAMLSSVLNSKRAIAVNIAIMRAFVRMRQILESHKALAERLAALEAKSDRRFRVVFDILKRLTEPPPEPSPEPQPEAEPEPPRRNIGFPAPVRRSSMGIRRILPGES